MRKRVREAEDLSTSSSSSTIQPLPQEALDIIFKFAFNRSLRDQQIEEVVKDEIGDSISRLCKRGRQKDAILANDKVVGTCCNTQRQACAELRLNLLSDNPFAPTLPQDNFPRLQYRYRWRLFCDWSRGGPMPDKYPTQVLARFMVECALRRGENPTWVERNQAIDRMFDNLRKPGNGIIARLGAQ